MFQSLCFTESKDIFTNWFEKVLQKKYHEQNRVTACTGRDFSAVTAKKNKWTYVSTSVTVARKYIYNLIKSLQRAFKV